MSFTRLVHFASRWMEFPPTPMLSFKGFLRLGGLVLFPPESEQGATGKNGLDPGLTDTEPKMARLDRDCISILPSLYYPPEDIPCSYPSSRSRPQHVPRRVWHLVLPTQDLRRLLRPLGPPRPQHRPLRKVLLQTQEPRAGEQVHVHTDSMLWTELSGLGSNWVTLTKVTEVTAVTVTLT